MTFEQILLSARRAAEAQDYATARKRRDQAIRVALKVMSVAHHTQGYVSAEDHTTKLYRADKALIDAVHCLDDVGGAA